jgi:redox-sensitive bicupin YhaK (pirin superfamily)
MNLFIDSIHHAADEMGKADDEQRIREAMATGHEIRIEAGKRAEFRVPPGSRPVVHVLEGAVRFEGDDTSAMAGDSVWFKPVPAGGEEGVIGIEADAAFVGLLGNRAEGGVPPRAAA